MTRQRPEKNPLGRNSQRISGQSNAGAVNPQGNTHIFSRTLSPDANADLSQRRQKVVILVPKAGAPCLTQTMTKSCMQYLAIWPVKYFNSEAWQNQHYSKAVPLASPDTSLLVFQVMSGGNETMSWLNGQFRCLLTSPAWGSLHAQT